MRWLYVTGPARSGTTLVEHMFNSHPQCFITHEHYSLTQMVKHLEGLSRPPESKEGGKAYMKAGKNPVLLETEKLYAERKNPPIGHLGGFDEVVRKLFKTADKTDVQVIGNKWPIHSEWSEDFDFLFQKLDLRIVAVVRNPVDTITSSMRRRNLAKEGFDEWNISSVQEALEEAAHGLETVRDLQARFPSKTFVFRYEHLMQSPTDVMARAFAVIGLSPVYVDEAVSAPKVERMIHLSAAE